MYISLFTYIYIYIYMYVYTKAGFQQRPLFEALDGCSATGAANAGMGERTVQVSVGNLWKPRSVSQFCC